jgi:hypothetical protein
MVPLAKNIKYQIVIWNEAMIWHVHILPHMLCKFYWKERAHMKGSACRCSEIDDSAAILSPESCLCEMYSSLSYIWYMLFLPLCTIFQGLIFP